MIACASFSFAPMVRISGILIRPAPSSLAHRVDLGTGQAHTLTDSAETSRFCAVLNNSGQRIHDLNNDSWNRFFAKVETR